MAETRGRPPHQPTDEMRKKVEVMAGVGNTEANIARILGMAPATLRLHYADELDNGALKANNAVAANLFRIATGQGREAVSAAQFWLKTRGGNLWRENTGPNVVVVRDSKEGAQPEPSAERKEWEALLAPAEKPALPN